ncbi:unnamed protein product [Paramecium octaurelia]|uniref:Uncharacterized protein n=1 Tax=Paramecium octaurelia TaxID=43137 RepID=A0A8S1TDD4_PAROT|nr:unnamed protein product [Paramecium octaurelia]
MNHINQPSKQSQKQTKSSKPALAHPEIHPNQTLYHLKNKQWMAAIQKEIDQFEQSLQEVDSMFYEASVSQIQMGLGNIKLLHNDYEFAAQKLHALKEMIAKFSEFYSKYSQKKIELNQTKLNITQDQKDFKLQIKEEREKIHFQFGISQRVLILIQAYIKMKDQFEDQEILQKHRDYILQKIEKIRKTEEKHNKKIEKHFNRIKIDNDLNNSQEIEDEEDQIYEQSGYEGINETVREHLIKLCDSLIAYFTKFEKKEGEYFLQHDLTTFQYFDQIKVAVPFSSAQIDSTLELIKDRRSFYENAPDTEFVQKGAANKEVKQQQQKVDVNNEQEFPKLS